MSKMCCKWGNEVKCKLSAVEKLKWYLRKRASMLPEKNGKNAISKILKENKFHIYKPHYIHTLKPGNYDRILEFCFIIQGKLENDPFWMKKYCFLTKLHLRLTEQWLCKSVDNELTPILTSRLKFAINIILKVTFGAAFTTINFFDNL